MSLLWPHMLWLALLAPALVAAEQLLARGRPRRGEAPTSPRILRGAVAGGRVRFDGKARRGPGVAWRFWLAFLLAVLALARPQWGQVGEAPGSRAPGEVVIALDLSRSMTARDVPPSRLTRARALAERLVEELPDRRIALVGFAGTAHLLAPASEDRAILNAFLPAIGPDHILQQGSNFGAMLDVATAAFDPARQGRALVILSDGEAEPGAWQDRIAGLRSRGVKVVALGLGTPGGAPVFGAEGRPLTASGGPVTSRLNPTSLAQLAQQTGGEYLDLTRARELPALVRAASAEPPEGAGQVTDATAARADQFLWFVAAALLLLAWSAAAEFAARPRLRSRRPVSPAARAAVAAMLLLAILPRPSEAARQLLTKDDLQGEEEPLQRMQRAVGALVAKKEPTAADWLQVVEAATRYGEIHRGHGHSIEDGVLRDGVGAVEAARRLDPKLADWAAAKAKLERLLVPPPPVPMDDPGPADPANEPMDGQGQQPQAGEDARRGEGDAPEDKQEPTAGAEGLQHVGGSERDVYDPSEWRNAALVQPLDQLQRLRAEDSTAELFLRMQAPPAPGAAARPQTW